MKKYISAKNILALCIISVLGFSACNTNNTEVSEDENYLIVESLGRYFDLINHLIDEFSILEEDIAYYNVDAADYEEYGYEPLFSCWLTTPDDIDSNIYYDVQNPYEAIPQETQELLVDLANGIIENINIIDEKCKDLDVYVSAQNYLDDDFAEGDLLVSELYLHLDSYYDQHEQVLDLVDSLMEEYANIEVDWSDPTQVAHAYMYEDLNLAEIILETVESAYIDDALGEENLSSLIETRDLLTANVESRTGDEKPNLTSESLENYFDIFYEEMTLNLLPISIRAERNFNAESIDDLGWDYSDLLDSYNWMIDYYNWYLDELHSA